MFDVDDLLRLRRLESVSLSPDGDYAVVAVARPSEDEARFVRDLWRVTFDGAAPTRLTQGDSNDRAPHVLTNGEVVFVSDRAHADDAPKTSQVWSLPLQGEPTRVTDEAAGVGGFVAAGDTIVVAAPTYVGIDDPHDHHAERAKAGPSAFHYRSMPVRHWQRWRGPPVHLLAYRDGKARDLTPDVDEELTESSFAITEDGGTVAAAFGRDLDRLRHDEIRVVNVSGDGPTRTMGSERARYGDLVFDPSGTRLCAARSTHRDDAPDKRQLVVFDVATGAEQIIAPEWDLFGAPCAWLDERTLLVAADDTSRRPLFAVTLEGEVTPIDGLGPSIHAADARGGRIAAVASGLGAPPRLLAAVSPVAPNGAVASEATSLDLARVGLTDAPANPEFRVEDLSVTASDGQSIQGLVAFPDGPGPHPLLLWIHGGPISQFGDQWHWRWNVAPFVAAGYAVALPNARGSTGRGDAFMAAIHRDWAGQCHRDLMDYAVMLMARDDVDASRVAAMGGSFGGYMCNWIGGHPDPRVDFRALITHASLYDLRAFYGATDYPAFFGDFMGGTPWDGDIESQSPHAGIADWKTPTLILHGEKDYRVPIGEALALFEALQAHDVPSELVVYPDEGHWIERPRNAAHWYTTILGFLSERLA